MGEEENEVGLINDNLCMFEEKRAMDAHGRQGKGEERMKQHTANRCITFFKWSCAAFGDA